MAWAKAAMDKQRKMRRAWNTLAAGFEQAGQPKLAQEIRKFVNAMPPALTEGEHFVAQAKKRLDKQQVKDRGRGRWRAQSGRFWVPSVTRTDQNK